MNGMLLAQHESDLMDAALLDDAGWTRGPIGDPNNTEAAWRLADVWDEDEWVEALIRAQRLVRNGQVH